MSTGANPTNAYRVLGSNGKPRPEFHWADPADQRDVLQVLTEEGVRFGPDGAADPAQRISSAELAALIDVFDEEAMGQDASALSALVGSSEWSWERYADELGVPEDRIAVGRELVDSVATSAAQLGLSWQTAFRKGYVAFQRAGGYNALVVDVYWRKPPRLAIKLPAEPGELGLVNPYPDLEEIWSPGDREWGWTLGELDLVPEVRAAVELAQRFQPETGPMSTERTEVDREHIRRQLEAGLTPDRVYEANGRSRSHC